MKRMTMMMTRMKRRIKRTQMISLKSDQNSTLKSSDLMVRNILLSREKEDHSRSLKNTG